MERFKGRAIAVDLLFKKQKKVRIIQTYIPVIRKELKEERIQVQNKIIEWINEMSQQQNAFTVIMGDFNTNMREYYKIIKENKLIPWHMKLIHHINVSQMIDTIKVRVSDNQSTWFKNELDTSGSWIDDIFITCNLADRLRSTEITAPIFNTDHRLVIASIDCNEITKIKENKRNEEFQSRSVYNYKAAKQEDWEQFTKTTDELNKKNNISSIVTLTETNPSMITNTWNVIRDVIVEAANKTLQTIDIEQERFYKENKRLRDINGYLKYFNKLIKQLHRDNKYDKNHNAELWKNLINLESELEFKTQSTLRSKTNWHKPDIQIVKKEIKVLIKELRTELKKTYKEITYQEIEEAIDRRCWMYEENKHTMINSLTDKKYTRIITDRLVQNNNGQLELIVNKEEIKQRINTHFQTVAGGVNFKENIDNSIWKQEYEAIKEINENIYKELKQDITKEEWTATIKSLPNGKAAGPNKISYELLKHLGEELMDNIFRLAKTIYKTGTIPEDWLLASIYPIPKNEDWGYDLNKTRPITLLDSTRKVLVKIITKKLGTIIANNDILKGGNHAGKLGGSTF